MHDDCLQEKRRLNSKSKVERELYVYFKWLMCLATRISASPDIARSGASCVVGDALNAATWCTVTMMYGAIAIIANIFAAMIA
jgi:hypothetical protein